MTTPSPKQARDYLDAFVRQALMRLRPGEEKGAWWEIGDCWLPAICELRDNENYAFRPHIGHPVGVGIGKLFDILVKIVSGDQVRLMLGAVVNPYDRPREAVDPTATLDTVPIAIAYEHRDGSPWCVIVTPRGIEDSPVAAVLPRSAMLLLGGPTVREAGRIFAGSYFRRNLTEALRMEGLSERVPILTAGRTDKSEES